VISHFQCLSDITFATSLNFAFDIVGIADAGWFDLRLVSGKPARPRPSCRIPDVGEGANLGDGDRVCFLGCDSNCADSCSCNSVFERRILLYRADIWRLATWEVAFDELLVDVPVDKINAAAAMSSRGAFTNRPFFRDFWAIASRYRRDVRSPGL